MLLHNILPGTELLKDSEEHKLKICRQQGMVLGCGCGHKGMVCVFQLLAVNSLSIRTIYFLMIC